MSAAAKNVHMATRVHRLLTTGRPQPTFCLATSLRVVRAAVDIGAARVL